MKQAQIWVGLAFVALLSACSSTHMIEPGVYQSGVDGVEPLDPTEPVELLYVDAESMQVRIEIDGRVVNEFAATRLSRSQWREGCQTNFSREVLETWALQDLANASDNTIFLQAACQGSGVVISTNTRTVLFGTPE